MTLFHPSGTLKMGPVTDPTTCVDRDLKVHGLKGLRVADLSVTPFLPSGRKSAISQLIRSFLKMKCPSAESSHLDPQIIAYVIGELAAEKIKAEWNL